MLTKPCDSWIRGENLVRNFVGKKKRKNASLVEVITCHRKLHHKKEASFSFMNIVAENETECNPQNLMIKSETGEVLTDRRPNGKERPWARHKGNAMKLCDMYHKAREVDKGCISDSRLRSLEECASYLLFGVDDEGRKKLHGANFCRLRTCPMCNWRKSLKLFGQVSKIVDVVLAEKPSTRFIFATFTVKNCSGDELANALALLNQAFSYLTGKSRNFAPAAAFKKSLEGYMKAIEITYNSNEDTYHPHIHCIFAVKASYFTHGYIKQADWVELWQRCAKLDYAPSVDVRSIKHGTARAVAEVAKYPVKMDELAGIGDRAVSALVVFSRVLKNRRLVTFGGVMADVKKRLALDDIEYGDLVHVDEQEKKFNHVAMALFQWRVGVGAYIC